MYNSVISITPLTEAQWPSKEATQLQQISRVQVQLGSALHGCSPPVYVFPFGNYFIFFFNFCFCFLTTFPQKNIRNVHDTSYRVKYIEITKFYTVKRSLQLRKDKDQLTAGVLELSC